MTNKYEVDSFKPRPAHAVLHGTMYRFPHHAARAEFIRDNLFDEAKPITRFQAWVLRLLDRVGL